MEKLLTVVTATYNKGERNRISIDSILRQTYEEFDYIVVDDGSSDNTREILSTFTDPRLKVIYQESKGFVDTMISVMEKVKTPYVAIHGAGDVSFSDRLKKQIDYLRSREHVGVVSCNTYSILSSQTPQIPEIFKKSKNSRHLKSVEYTTVEQMIRSNVVDHGDAMIRMSAYRMAGGYRPFFKYSQDRDLWLRMLETHSVSKIKEALYVKISDPKSDISGNPSKSEVQAIYSLFARHIAKTKRDTGVDVLADKGAGSFSEFVSELDSDAKEEIIGRVFRNGLKDITSVDCAIEIIEKYEPEHSSIKSLRTFKRVSSLLPRGDKLYRFYISEIKSRILARKARIKKRITLIRDKR